MLIDSHKSSKGDAYWDNLTGGETGRYKARVLDGLLRAHLAKPVEAILDIGCGTSDIAFRYRDLAGGARLVCMDYDAAIVEAARRNHPDEPVEWRVADIFEIDRWQDRFDIVFMLDMLHEVYSFRGRTDLAKAGEIDHARGLAAAEEALAKIATVVAPGGGIVITDNVLSPETGPVTVRLRNEAAQAAVERFLAEYPSRRMAVGRPEPGVIRLAAHDFCILLTQYNKIKSGQEDRWRVEQLEIHQYMTERQYRETFDRLGFDAHIVIGTPDSQMQEWRDDFAVLDGMAGLPEKRVTLLAVKRG